MANEQRLMEQAREARLRAYAPYSQFQVGCVLVGHDDRSYLGCNVENAAYSPTNCAERTALFSAIAAGHEPRTFKTLAVIGDTDLPIAPCGVCRQVMAELCAPDMPVLLANLKGDYTWTTVAELLPGAFSLPTN